MKIILSHPTGNANVRAAAKGFVTAGLLHEFHTTIASFPGTILNKLGKIGPLTEISRRSFDPILRSYTRTWPWRELARMLSLKAGISKLTFHENGIFCVDAVYQNLDRQVAKSLGKAITKKVNAVYAYEDGALLTFKKAKETGLRRIYDLPIVYWEKRKELLFEEAERLPVWSKTLCGGINDSQQKLDRKSKELELAEMIICPSNFVMNSLPESAKGKYKILATFGSPCASVETEWIRKKHQKINSGPLRVLFAGSLGQRKGLADLFAAIKLINNKKIELVVMGSLIESMGFYKKQLENFRYEPVRSHEDVLKLMQTCDIFCLPSIAEGRALVMQEAMSQGLPLIITENTGGSDLIKEGVTGFLVPIRSPYAIAEKLSWLSENKSSIAEMAIAAKNHTAQYTWEKYSDTIVQSIKKL